MSEGNFQNKTHDGYLHYKYIDQRDNQLIKTSVKYSVDTSQDGIGETISINLLQIRNPTGIIAFYFVLKATLAFVNDAVKIPLNHCHHKSGHNIHILIHSHTCTNVCFFLSKKNYANVIIISSSAI